MKSQPLLIRDIGEFLTLQGVIKKDGRKITESDLGIIKNAALLLDGNNIIWWGEQKKIPKTLSKIKKLKEFSAKKQTLLPGFVECHTHSLFAGSRAQEFELRNQGVSYQEIANRGGGILSTMKKTREESLKKLTETGKQRVKRFIEQGVTTLEIKSGYALNLKDEIKLLQAAKSINSIRIVPTFLGAHALPPEFKSHSDYLQYLSTSILPVIKKKKLSNRVDIFIEKGFFENPFAANYLNQAKNLGFDITIHADQLSLSGGTQTAIDLCASSADHVIQINEELIKKISASNTTAVLLPAADLYMKCKYPPARQLIDNGARVALATDFNPGSSPTQDLSLVGLLARLEMKMTLPEVIASYTYNAWKSLYPHCDIKNGFWSADFISTGLCWTDLFYSVGQKMSDEIIFSGNIMDVD